MTTSGNAHLYGQWEEKTFNVLYHKDFDSEASKSKTLVHFGEWTKTLTTTQLNFSKSGYKFKGWAVYRENEGTWYVKDQNGNKKFISLKDRKLPDGYDYVLYKNGANVAALTTSGNAHLYAVWEKK